MAGETNIGGIVGFLRLEADQFHREIQQALLETDALNGKRVKVDVDTGSLDRVPTSSRNAASGMDEAVKSSRRLEDATNRVRLAELKLYEANDSGKASKIFAAQTELTRARRGEIDAVWGTYDANIGLTQVQDKVVESNRKVAQSSAKVEETEKKAAKATQEHRAQVGLLGPAIIGLGPALVPIAAGAAGLGVAFGGMGVAGLAAFMGIKQAMGANNAVGQAYQRTIDSARVGLEQLAATAASNVLGSFQTAVADLNGAMPVLTAQIGDLSSITGRAGAAIVSGLVSAFQALGPLMLDASIYVLDLTQRFQAAASGSGMTQFADYIRSTFPMVVQDVESIVTAVAKLVAAFAPLGLGTLQTLRVFSDLISAIPTAALSEIATLASSVFIGFKAWQALSVPIAGLTKMLGGVEEMSTRAAGAIRGLQAAAGLVGIALAGLSILMSQNAESQRTAQQATDDYADALRRSNGVMDESIRKVAYDTLQKQGAIDAAKKLGIGLGDVTLAATGNRDAMDRVNVVIMDAIRNHRDLWGAAHDLRAALGLNNTELNNAQQANKDLADATGQTVTVTRDSSAAAQDLADKYGLNVTVYDQVVAGQKQIADQAELATAKMQQQNDAAGLLKDALDRLNGKALSNEEAKNAYDRAGNALASPIDAAKAKIAAAEKAQAAAAAAVSGAQGKSGSVASNGGHVSSGAANALARAQLAATQAQEHLTAVQSNGKATANQLESAQNRVETSSLRLAQAQAKAGTATGGSTQAQKDAAAKAVGNAQAQKDAADAAVAAAKADLIAQRALDGSSEAAVRNRDNIINMVKAAETASGTNGNLAKSSEAARQKFIQMREDVIKQATAQGLNTDKVRAYLDVIAEVPTNGEVIDTGFQADTAPAVRTTKEWMGVIDGVPTWKTVTFKAKTADALAAVANVREAIAGVLDKTVTISAVYQALGQPAALAAHNALTLDRHGIPQANGGIFQGGVRKMAEGGFAGRESTIMRSTNPILWNEAPGGEAYISLAPEKRARSLAIHSQVGALLGANGGSGGRLHPDDIGMLARALGREISRIPTPQIGINQLDAARGGY